jgi:GNAT-family acetyltransferase (TIGR03103 family)
MGVSLMVQSTDELELAIKRAREICSKVVLEKFIEGQDLRIVVINFEVVAAAVRKPAEVVGDGTHTVKELIQKQSRRREMATGGESFIPIDKETENCIQSAGYGLSDVLAPRETLRVRKTANLHTGGTIHDVTAALHPALKKAAVLVAKTINIPVVGVDFIVDAPDKDAYVFIEANERPGLANHEPQPTAQKFIDMCFPDTQSPGASE